MKNKNIIVFLVVFCIFFTNSYAAPMASVNERNPYEIFGADGNYFINKTFDIVATGTSFDSYNEVKAKAFYKAGQTAYEHGCEYFLILNDTITSEIVDYTDIQLHENAWGKVTATGGDPIRQSSGILTIVILTSDEIDGINLPIYRALDYYDSRDSIPTDYKHQVQLTAGYIPIPKNGWKINGSYNYIINRFGFGIGIEYNTDVYEDWDYEYEDFNGLNFGYTNKKNFYLYAPVKFYIIKPNTHSFIYMDICIAPGWHHQNCNIEKSINFNDYKEKKTYNGFCADFRYELGLALELATFDLYIDYNLSTIENVLSVGGGFSFFL